MSIPSQDCYSPGKVDVLGKRLTCMVHPSLDHAPHTRECNSEQVQGSLGYASLPSDSAEIQSIAPAVRRRARMQVCGTHHNSHALLCVSIMHTSCCKCVPDQDLCRQTVCGELECRFTVHLFAAHCQCGAYYCALNRPLCTLTNSCSKAEQIKAH